MPFDFKSRKDEMDQGNSDIQETANEDVAITTTHSSSGATTPTCHSSGVSYTALLKGQVNQEQLYLRCNPKTQVDEAWFLQTNEIPKLGDICNKYLSSTLPYAASDTRLNPSRSSNLEELSNGNESPSSSFKDISLQISDKDVIELESIADDQPPYELPKLCRQSQVEIELCSEKPNTEADPELLVSAQPVRTLAILDSGSQMSWISARLLQMLEISGERIRPLPRPEYRKEVNTFNGSFTVRYFVRLWYRCASLGQSAWEEAQFHVFESDSEEIVCFSADYMTVKGWVSWKYPLEEEVGELTGSPGFAGWAADPKKAGKLAKEDHNNRRNEDRERARRIQALNARSSASVLSRGSASSHMSAHTSSTTSWTNVESSSTNSTARSSSAWTNISSSSTTTTGSISSGSSNVGSSSSRMTTGNSSSSTKPGGAASQSSRKQK